MANEKRDVSFVPCAPTAGRLAKQKIVASNHIPIGLRNIRLLLSFGIQICRANTPKRQLGGSLKRDLRQIVARHITIPPTGVGGFFRSDLRDIRLQLRVRVEYPRRRSRLVFRSSLLDERLNFPIGTLTVCVGGILKLRRLTSAVS